MGHTKKTTVCLMSAVWAAVVTLYTLLHILRMDSDETVFGHFCKIATMALGAMQFTLSGMLLSYIVKVQTNWAKRYYLMYLLTAITMSSLYMIYYVFKETRVEDDKFFWGFTYYDAVMYIDMLVFVIFILCYPTPKPNTGNTLIRNMNVDWIARSATGVPERVIVEHEISGNGTSKTADITNKFEYNNIYRIDKNNFTNLPYSRMGNESIA